MPRRRVLSVVVFGIAGWLLLPASVFAATLTFGPEVQTVAAGQTFTVKVLASSPDQAMNAVSGDISFPTDKLRVISVLTTGSAMTLWVQNPSFSNVAGAGDVNFAGIVLNPGFTGNNANIITIRFQAVATGDAKLAFSTGSILANDGNGSNILKSFGQGDVTIVPAAPASPAPSAGSTLPPPAPIIPVQTSTAFTSTLAQASSTESNPATGSNWFMGVMEFILSWAAIIIVVLMLLAVILALAACVVYFLWMLRVALRRRLVREQEEFREELEEYQIPRAPAMPPSPQHPHQVDLRNAAPRSERERIRINVKRQRDEENY